MICDDCGLETGTNGNHATDSFCMEAQAAELELFRTALRAARDEIQNKVPVEKRDCVLYDRINNVLGELAGGDRERKGD
jgi:hypothetical protein